MPFDVTRFGASRDAGADSGTSMSAGWTSGMSGTLGIGPDGPVVQCDREQQVEQIGDLARVAAGALLDPAQPVLRGVGVDLQLPAAALTFRSASAKARIVRSARRRARVLVEELAHPRVDEPARRVVHAQRQVAERGEVGQRDDPPPSPTMHSSALAPRRRRAGARPRRRPRVLTPIASGMPSSPGAAGAPRGAGTGAGVAVGAQRRHGHDLRLAHDHQRAGLAQRRRARARRWPRTARRRPGSGPAGTAAATSIRASRRSP